MICSVLLRAAEQKLEASEQIVIESNRLVEKLRDELRLVKAELAERTHLGKRYDLSYTCVNSKQTNCICSLKPHKFL